MSGYRLTGINIDVLLDIDFYSKSRGNRKYSNVMSKLKDGNIPVNFKVSSNIWFFTGSHPGKKSDCHIQLPKTPKLFSS